jgi:AcrR family transcriptional regulator
MGPASVPTAPPRRRGRPAANAAVLDLERIVDAARTAMERGSGDFSMRAIAAALGVDPMALYHHVPSKRELIDAVVEKAFAGLDRLQPRLVRLAGRGERLFALALAYLRCVAPIPRLTQHLARGPEGAAHRRFQALFALALGREVREGSREAIARDLLVDYLHGVALAGRKESERALRAAWPLLLRAVDAADSCAARIVVGRVGIEPTTKGL